MSQGDNEHTTGESVSYGTSRASNAAGSSTTPGHRLLRRSKKNNVIAGLAGGLGRYLDIEPAIFRIAFLLLLVPGGIGLLIYIIGWIAIPEFKSEQEEEWDNAAPPVRSGTAGVVVGGTLILLGVLILLQQILPWFDTRIIGALVLIIVGAAVVIRGMRSERNNT